MRKDRNKPKREKLRLGLWPSLLLLFLAAGVTYMTVNFIVPDFWKWHAYFCLQNLSLGWLNFLPVFFLMLFFYFLTNNAVFSGALWGSLLVIMAMVDRIKIIFRQDPLVPADFGVVKEAFAIVGDFDPSLVIIMVAAVLVTVALIVCSLRYFGGKKQKPLLRIVAMLLIVVCASSMYFTVYRDDELYKNYPINGSKYSKVDQYGSRGLVYSFIYDTWAMRKSAPAGYNEQEFAAREAEAADPAAYVAVPKPHLIVIMSEAFTDFSENEHLNFDGHSDPLANFKRLREDAVLSGHIVASVYGGGTAATEFEVLTAARAIDVDSAISPYKYVRHRMESMVSLLESVGYETLAQHPGDGWFYNRRNVYDYMGFDQFSYIGHGYEDSMGKKGMYISEQATFDVLLSEFEQRLRESDAPQFDFCVTIQNHGGYDGKYGEIAQNFNSDLALSDTAIAELSGYFVGIADADAQLARLVEQLQATDEPVVLLYFGDHRPAFGDAYSLLDPAINRSGDEEQVLNACTTPFLLWQNDSAAAMSGLPSAVAARGLTDDMRISANYLGALLTELLGYEGLSPFFDYANELRTVVPVTLFNTIYELPDGSITRELTAGQQKLFDAYARWAYYKVYDQGLK